MRAFKSFLTVIGAVTVLVLAANTVAYAATGGKFILGKVNKAGNVSTLKRTTSGPALSLGTTSSAAAPMTVNGKGKVANLNADLLDGLDSTALAGVRANVYRYAFSTSANIHNKALPPLAAGVYLATFDVPMSGAAGTQASPGGAYCEFIQSGLERGVVQATPSRAGWDPMLSSTTVISTSNGNQVNLYCSSVNAWTTTANFPAEVTFTKLDGAALTAATDPSSRIASGARTAPAD